MATSFVFDKSLDIKVAYITSPYKSSCEGDSVSHQLETFFNSRLKASRLSVAVEVLELDPLQLDFQVYCFCDQLRDDTDFVIFVNLADVVPPNYNLCTPSLLKGPPLI